MYQVKITVKATDPNNSAIKFKPITHTGIFFPKGKQCTSAKIKEQVTRRILATYKDSHPDLEYITTVTIKRISDDFFFKEQ